MNKPKEASGESIKSKEVLIQFKYDFKKKKVYIIDGVKKRIISFKKFFSNDK